MRTVWVLGDQLNRQISSLAGAEPATSRVLMVESAAKLRSKAFHRQRLHLLLASMRRFAGELASVGFDVDYRQAESLGAGLAAHRQEFEPDEIVAMEPMSHGGLNMLRDCEVNVVDGNQFFCHYRDFIDWCEDRTRITMEDFYRWQRVSHGYLMDGDEPAGGKWNYDRENREPPPDPGFDWPEPLRDELDELDREVLAALPDTAWGAPPNGTWATDRAGAQARLDHFVKTVLPDFGPYQDAMLRKPWALAHSLLSPYLNIGLLTPAEVCDAAEAAYRAGDVQIASAEGFIRQVIGWREYVWGVYWRDMPHYAERNALGADRPLPPAIREGSTQMACVRECWQGVHDRAYAHHIQRLMVLGNLALLAGVRPWEMVEWMWRSFIDGAEWVMVPNVIGMSLHADGGVMATKPYAAGGNYVSKMSDYCGDCAYDPKRRTGDKACPFTTLYWDFLDRHRERFADNHRMSHQMAGLRRRDDLDAIRARAGEVLDRLGAGTL